MYILTNLNCLHSIDSHRKSCQFLRETYLLIQFFFFRHMFESLKAYCLIQMSSIPMTFVLGFYVSLIVKRWWDQYNLLPWPDSLAIFIAGLINGIDERGRLMRRNIMRYVLLSYVITLRRVSFRYSAGNLVLAQIDFRIA